MMTMLMNIYLMTMNKYIIVSIVLFGLCYLGILIGELIYGGQAHVPGFLQVVFSLIVTNVIIAMIVLAINIIRGKI